MRGRRDRETRRPVSAVTRIQNDLERRGVSRNFSGAVAARLERGASDLSEEEYLALLDGVAAAYGVHRGEQDRGSRDDPTEIRRIVHDFAIELKKLDEGLQILSSYVLRIRDRTSEDAPGVIH
jgi:hypothetical protein